MSVHGELYSMPLPELLQWLGANGKTGTLEIERDKVCKTIVFEGGRVVSCSSNDPSELLGHYLVARGQVTEDLLRIALDQQSTTGKQLGMTLVEMGVLTGEELTRNLHAKAEETIFSLFEWEHGVFRFQDQAKESKNLFPTDIRVEDVLLRGMQRMDEIRHIREVIVSDRLIPKRTGKLPPPEVFRNKIARGIYEAIDGERTIADILLHAHGSVYIVTKFVFELHRTNLIELAGEKPAPPAPGPPEPAPAGDVKPSEPESQATPIVPEAGHDPKPSPAIITGIGGSAMAAAAEPDAFITPEPTRPVPVQAPSPAPTVPAPRPDPGLSPEELDMGLILARQFMADGEFDAALEILDQIYRKNPNNESLRRLTQEAEVAFMEKARKYYMPEEKIPVLTRPVAELETEDLSPQEFFLLSRIDGAWDVRSIIQIAPIRDVEALRILKKMRENGVIELRDPD